MIQRGERTRLLLETGESVGILREEVGQDLDRDRTMKLRVVRAIDLAHAAAPSKDSILNGPSWLPGARRLAYRGCEYGRLAKRSGVVVCPEQRLDGSPQCGIVTAGFVEIRVPRWPIKGGGLGEYAADVGPSIGIDSGLLFHVLTLPFARLGRALLEERDRGTRACQRRYAREGTRRPWPEAADLSALRDSQDT
jgi:hypothetical protein